MVIFVNRYRQVYGVTGLTPACSVHYVAPRASYCAERTPERRDVAAVDLPSPR